MAKFIVAFFLILTIPISGFSQSQFIDSIRLIIDNNEPPLEKFTHLADMMLKQNNNKGSVIDSTSLMTLHTLAQQLNNDSLLAISYNWIGSYFFYTKGENAFALDNFEKAIPLASKNDKRRISSIYFDAALIYFDLLDFEKALNTTQKGKDNLPDKLHSLYDFMLIQYQSNMCNYFLFTNKPDSALYYTNELIATNSRLNNISYEFISGYYTGTIYSLLGLELKADSCFKAIQHIYLVPASYEKYTYYKHYIRFLLKYKRFVEAKGIAHELLSLGTNMSNSNYKLEGVHTLREVYDMLNKRDSAYYYAKMEYNLKELMAIKSNKDKIQAFAFNDEIRKIDEERKKKIDEERKKVLLQSKLQRRALIVGLSFFFIIAIILLRNNRQKQKSNLKLESTLSDLKAAQSQLIHSEKMASLGELTAGIAHEIQNPLNFVNNFSEVSNELIDEMKEELAVGNQQLAVEIANDIKQNLEKINHHGKRADAIVKNMLQHSRSNTGHKEPTDINALADEYLRLSYHGMRAKDKSFNADIKTDFDPNLPKINVIPQDIGRVLLNLINNAFYAVTAPPPSRNEFGTGSGWGIKNAQTQYVPTVTVSTSFLPPPKGGRGAWASISVRDNGSGIPAHIVDKIFQPFFTTKPAGQGTGLGLSLSYDIVKAHGGELKVETKEGEGSEFIIELPIT